MAQAHPLLYRRCPAAVPRSRLAPDNSATPGADRRAISARSTDRREPPLPCPPSPRTPRSEEHTSELQSLMRISYAVFCLNKKKQQEPNTYTRTEVPTTIP